MFVKEEVPHTSIRDDEEHGLCVVVEGNQIVTCDTAEEALLFWFIALFVYFQRYGPCRETGLFLARHALGIETSEGALGRKLHRAMEKAAR